MTSCPNPAQTRATFKVRFLRILSSQALDVSKYPMAPLDTWPIAQGICFPYIQEKFLLVQPGPHGAFLCTSKKSFSPSLELSGSKLKTEIPSALHPGLLLCLRLLQESLVGIWRQKFDFPFIQPSPDWPNPAPCGSGWPPVTLGAFPALFQFIHIWSWTGRSGICLTGMGWTRRNFPLETALLQPGMDMVSVLVSILVPGFKGFPAPCLE